MEYKEQQLTTFVTGGFLSTLLFHCKSMKKIILPHMGVYDLLPIRDRPFLSGSPLTCSHLCSVFESLKLICMFLIKESSFNPQSLQSYYCSIPFKGHCVELLPSSLKILYASVQAGVEVRYFINVALHHQWEHFWSKNKQNVSNVCVCPMLDAVVSKRPTIMALPSRLTCLMYK